MKNQLFYGDNLDILRDHIADESVDLIYLDPPFNSNRNYNVLFKEKSGEESPSQIEAFTDTWVWNQDAEYAYHELTTNPPEQVANMIEAMRQFIGTNDMMAYLVMMAQRMKELHRVLKPTGSIYLHCDPTASHYLKMLMDTVFGVKNYVNEIVWKRTGTKGDAARKFGAVHDVILTYAKTQDYVFNPQFLVPDDEYLARYRLNDNDGRGPYRLGPLDSPNPRPNLTYEYKGYPPPAKGWRVSREVMERLDAEGRLAFPKSLTGRISRKLYLSEQLGPRVADVWTDITPLQASERERLGYPTQKPLALLERIIQASSNEGAVVLDPFCGCGTAVVAAQKLNRRWIGIDITHLAVSLIRTRLIDHFGDEIAEDIEVHGEPKDLGAARALFDHDPYQFEWWALALVNAMPANDKKKGADKGVDGIIRFHVDTSGKTRKAVVQVKGGKVQSHYIRDLKGTMQREKADMGVLVTLQKPTRAMVEEAATAGVFETPTGHVYPAVQIITIEELLDGKKLRLPSSLDTFQKASKITRQTSYQQDLGLDN